jgi:hypothetical protein
MQTRIREVNLERAIELSEELTDKTVHEGDSSTVFSGTHPELGSIHIAIPPLGNSLLLPADLAAVLPVVIQGLSL